MLSAGNTERSQDLTWLTGKGGAQCTCRLVGGCTSMPWEASRLPIMPELSAASNCASMTEEGVGPEVLEAVSGPCGTGTLMPTWMTAEMAGSPLPDGEAAVTGDTSLMAAEREKAPGPVPMSTCPTMGGN